MSEQALEERVAGARSVPARRPSRVAFVIALPLAAVLLVFALRGVSWAELVGAVRQGDGRGIIAAIALISLSYFVRGLRWRVLIEQEARLSALAAFWLTMVGYLGNSFLPARAGDVLRPLATGRTTRASTSYALAAALVERVADTLVLVALSLAAPLILPNLPGWLRGAATLMATIGVVSVLGCAFAVRFEERFTALVTYVTRSERLRTRVIALMQTFLRGIRALGTPNRALRFTAYTAGAWMMDVATAAIIARALHLAMDWRQCLLLLVALGLGSAAPSTPGYVGIYQFIAVSVLVPFGLTRSEALAFIFVFQAVTYAAVVLWGAGGMAWAFITPRIADRDTVPDRKLQKG